VRALTLGRQLRLDDLVHQRDVGLGVEQCGGQLDRAVLLTCRGVDVDLQSL
jgi:hypothetical protein